MDYTEDELIDTIRRLDEEIAELTADVQKAETKALDRMKSHGGHYDPESAPGGTCGSACTVCGISILNWAPIDPEGKQRDLRFSIDPNSDRSAEIVICNQESDETLVEFSLSEDMVTWLGNAFLDIRDSNW